MGRAREAYPKTCQTHDWRREEIMMMMKMDKSADEQEDISQLT